ncbi:MAG: transposase domain-containing protein [Roseibium sp.]|uniref:transposase domain-containing protein n=1 Tax=Roseibium sp. TaxID=1936156 RepID=UPI001B2E80C8|nr:transposase domain-containing protein [Roseibium sp.]MBO6931056.1 transposase domain-containing protein [Roseibium sp.]
MFKWTLKGPQRVSEESSGRSTAKAYTLIKTAKLNGIEPKAWLTWFLEKIADLKINRNNDLMRSVTLQK